MSFLGHVVSADGVATDPEKLKAVLNWLVPKNLKQVRSFIGFCSYYRRYVKGFADIARPLHKLTEAGQKFEFNDSCMKAFETLKNALTSAPILGYPTSDDPFILDTDASNDGMGAVLSQTQNGVERVIGYFSKAFSKQERRYCVTRRELLAVVASIKHFHHYLYGQKFLVRSDHGALRWIFNFKNPEGQLARWLETLATYDFKIEHRAGRVHSNADGLSRRPCCEFGCNYCLRAEMRYENSDLESKDQILNIPESVYNQVSIDSKESPTNNNNSNHSVNVVTRSQTKSDNKCTLSASSEKTTESGSVKHYESDMSLPFTQRRDPIIGKVYDWKLKGLRPEWQEISTESVELKHYWSKFDSMVLDDEILYHKWESDTGRNDVLQILLPESLRLDVLHHLHNSPTGAHLGVKKTLAKVRLRYFWYGLCRDVENCILKCDACASRKAPNRKPKAPMKLYSVGVPMERLAIDIAGPLPKTNKGHKYIVVISDYFTKWTQAFAIKDQEATTVANILVNEVVSLFGVPRMLHSDKGSNFESKVFMEMCKILGIDKTRTTTRRPQSDGMVERNIKTIKAMLTAFVNKSQRNWDKYLSLLLMAYRSSVHESTGMSPCAMMLGREITLPVDIIYGTPEKDKEVPSSQYAYDLQECLTFIHNFARENLKLSGQTMKKYYDHKSCHKVYDIGTLVWLYIEKQGITRKLGNSWHGPFVITHRLNDTLYRIQEKQNSKPKVVHHDKLKLYTGDKPATWFKNQ